MANTGMKRRGFVNDQKSAILERLKIFYGPPSLQELNQALLRLHYPMDCNQPVDVMLHATGVDCDLSDVNIISYAMIKISKCGGLYQKAIERWQSKTKIYKKIWANFRQPLIAEY